MSWHLVAGVPLPDAVGGHPALDFCNTRAGWSAPHPKEYLTSPSALALWAMDAGLLPDQQAQHPQQDRHPRRPPQGGEAREDDVLLRALRLRDALYRCLLGAGAPPDWAAVAGEIAAARAVSTLRPDADGRVRWVIDARGLTPAAAALHAAADAAEDLLRSSLAGCVAACPGAGCGWLFADRRRRRRWCSMAVCGNRAKARRHAARRHDVTPRDGTT